MALKQCNKCDKEKVVGLFNWKNKALGLRHTICRECHADYRKEHYLNKRDVYISKATAWNRKQKIKLQKIVYNYLSDKSCVDCSEADIIVLDFDHRSNKIKGISEMVKSCCSANKLISEIKKCDIRCANCHRRKNSKKFNYWKSGV